MVGKRPLLFFAGSLLVGLMLCTGCVTTPGSKETKGGKGKEQEAPALPCAQALQIPIGTVHLVDQEGKFALIKSSRSLEIEPDTRIMAYGPDARMSSQLKVSPARKGSFLTADLVAGTPSVGDMVTMIHSVKPEKKDEEEGDSDVQVLE